MNDIEIFKILEDIIKGDEDCIKTISCGLNNQKNDEDVEHYKREIEAIINIVNLYKKEKARADKLEKEYSQMLTKIDNLEQIEQEHKKENGRLREELSQYKRIDKLVSNITPEEVDTAIKRASEQFIEVSKVEKELIQLNKDEKTELKGMKGQNKYFLKQQYAAKREILEKVLKMKGR